MALGCAAADYDNDGLPDIYITRARRQPSLSQSRKREVRRHNCQSRSARRRLLNRSSLVRLRQTMANSTSSSRTMSNGRLPPISTALSMESINPIARPSCTKARTRRSITTRGNGTFEDVTEKAGLYDPTSKSLGVALLDYDNDGWLDLFVANDTQPNKLYHNNHNGTFTDEAFATGVAFSDAGKARAGMGADAADYDLSRSSGTGHRKLR